MNHELPRNKSLVFPVRQVNWEMAAEREAYRQRGELPPCDFSTPRFSSSLRPASSEPNPWSHCKQISIFSSERLWISFCCQGWWYRAGMSYIHLIVSFIVVPECAAAYSQITWAQSSEGDLSVRRRQDKSDTRSSCARAEKKQKQPCTCSRRFAGLQLWALRWTPALPTHTNTKPGEKQRRTKEE